MFTAAPKVESRLRIAGFRAHRVDSKESHEIVEIRNDQGVAIRVLIYPTGWFGFATGDQPTPERISGRSFSTIFNMVSHVVAAHDIEESQRECDDHNEGTTVRPARWDGPVPFTA